MKDVFSPEAPLVLVGCGHMGRAMAKGWLTAGLPADALYVVDPVASEGALPGVPASNYVTGFDELGASVTVRSVILAVKPQIIDAVLPSLKGKINAETLVISIAAGVTLDQMSRGVSAEAVLVRAMPNTPAAVGAGITGLTAEPGIDAVAKQIAMDLLSAIGPAVWIDREDQMDSVTAVSGSGPAYVFHLVECMAAAGAREGLPEDIAMQLARQTIIGAARLMESESDVSAAELRQRVTSPGGTTAAALSVLMEDEGMSKLMRNAIKAARQRGKELAG